MLVDEVLLSDVAGDNRVSLHDWLTGHEKKLWV